MNESKEPLSRGFPLSKSATKKFHLELRLRVVVLDHFNSSSSECAHIRRTDRHRSQLRRVETDLTGKYLLGITVHETKESFYYERQQADIERTTE